MTKKPTRLHAKDDYTLYPRELGPERVDMAGKEPVPLPDWDQPTVLLALELGQPEIIQAEVERLERISSSWASPVRRRIWREMVGIPSDLVGATLAKCRLDNLDVRYDTEASVDTMIRPA